MRSIAQYASDHLNAGPKAKVDVENILKEKYDCKILTFNSPGAAFYSNFFKKRIEQIKKFVFCLLHIKGKELTIIQAPFVNKKFFTNRLKNKIVLIHDLEGLRYGHDDKNCEEIEFLKTCECIISHNIKMSSFLIENGIEKDKIIDLELFDYLCNDFNKETKKKINKKLEIGFVGNLTKSPFLIQIKDSKMNFVINLYGVLGDIKITNKKINYKGKFKPDELPNVIDCDLGLVWDGNLDESDENEGFKNYSKYNNPHKLSCYVASNIPVIVWEKSAAADFVKKHNIGYTIKEVYDINKLDLSDYDVKLKNVSKIGNKVRNGEYTLSAIERALKKK